MLMKVDLVDKKLIDILQEYGFNFLCRQDNLFSS